MQVDLKARRELLCLTQLEVAVKAAVSVSTVQAVESGRAKNLHARTRRKLAEAYGITPDQLPGQPSVAPEVVGNA